MAVNRSRIVSGASKTEGKCRSEAAEPNNGTRSVVPCSTAATSESSVAAQLQLKITNIISLSTIRNIFF